LLTTRSDIGATVTRFRGMTYQEREEGKISNLYEATFINKTFDDRIITLEPEDEDFSMEIVGEKEWELKGQSKFEGRFFLTKDRQNIQYNQGDVVLLLKSEGEVIKRIKTSFLGPSGAQNLTN